MLVLKPGVWGARITESDDNFLLAGRGLKPPLLGTTPIICSARATLGAVSFTYSRGWADTLYGAVPGRTYVEVDLKAGVSHGE
jgi:Na+/proline symporter